MHAGDGMKKSLSQRLNQILPHITSDEFLSSQGIGNEIACYIFDYPAEKELEVRQHIQVMEAQLTKTKPTIKALHFNLFDVMLDLLNQRGLLDRALEFDTKKGPEKALGALRGPLGAEKIRDFLVGEYDLASQDLILMSGVGSAWPALRAHNVLNCLHPVLEGTPLVMFYPGKFDGTSLRLFGGQANEQPSSSTSAYYRAFRLIPEE